MDILHLNTLQHTFLQCQVNFNQYLTAIWKYQFTDFKTVFAIYSSVILICM